MEQHHAEDVGRILLDVHDQLKTLRASIESTDGTAGVVPGIHAIIAQAERDLQAKAELVLSSVVQSTTVSLPVVPGHRGPEMVRPGSGLSGWNDQSGGLGGGNNTMGGSSMGTRGPRSMLQAPQRTQSLVKDRLARAREMEYIHNPNTDDARKYMQDRFGIQEPSKPVPRSERVPRHAPGSRRRGKVSKPNRILPAKNRGDAHAPPPPIDDQDIEQGLLSLMNRGMLPSNVDLSAAFARGAAPVTQQPSAFHDRALDPSLRPGGPPRAPASSSMYGFNMSTIKLDVRNTPPKRRAAPPPEPQQTVATTQDLGAAAWPNGGGATAAADAAARGLAADVDKIRGYNELLDEYSLHQFIIRRGRALMDTPEFKSFQRSNEGRWGGILRVIEALEAMLTLFSVPMAFIDGMAVAKLAMDELAQLSTERLLECVANVDQVESLLRQPGRRFLGSNTAEGGGAGLAATLVQSQFRAYRCRSRYNMFMHQRDATVVIQRRWKQFQAMAAARGLLRRRRAENRSEWRRMREELQAGWASTKRKRRTEIHFHSISRDEQHRLGIPHFQARENMQLSRLCALADPLVDIVYVAPFEINDDVRSYYAKLLEVGGVRNPEMRFKVVVPENIHRFPEHTSLAAALLYSPRALRQIRRYVRGQTAYIVPGVVGPEDKTLALYLKIPLLAADPDAAAVLGSKSGSKRVFTAADVNIPAGAHDIYEEGELFVTIAKLIAAYPDVARWLVKLDDEWGGRGHCCLDVGATHELRNVVAELQGERNHFSKHDAGYWGRQEVQETARKRLMAVVPAAIRRHASISCPEVYPDWRRYVAGIERIGCVVEALPNETVGSPSASLFIEPDGTVNVIATHEQIFSAPFKFCGSVFPQQSAPHAAVRGAATAIGNVLFKKGVYGHVGVDFVAFWDPYVFIGERGGGERERSGVGLGGARWREAGAAPAIESGEGG